jgi:adenine-specific DNA-methyltransferase
MTVKYMGSKRAMLKNGLGAILKRQIGQMVEANRFVDLFSGSGAVAVHVAQQFNVPVLAFDLQKYSAVITNAVISRQAKLDWKLIWENWHRNAQAQFVTHAIPNALRLTQPIVAEFRKWCGNQILPITKAYGGHYFSPSQTVWIDALRITLPENDPYKTVALAALIQAASHSVASPGHTAQPFQPTRTAKKHLEKAWAFDVVAKTKMAFEELSGQFAKQVGSALVGNANEAADQLAECDLAFIDPPYSGEHYSRFYHVLETIAVGVCGEVFGVGRYPSADLRPRSDFSLKSQSEDALDDLLETIASRGAKAILTFPDHECSNGLSGDLVTEIAAEHFYVKERFVESSFSTMGGTGIGNNASTRHPRQQVNELILVLKPK